MLPWSPRLLSLGLGWSWEEKLDNHMCLGYANAHFLWLEHEFAASDTVAEKGPRGHVKIEISTLASLLEDCYPDHKFRKDSSLNFLPIFGCQKYFWAYILYKAFLKFPWKTEEQHKALKRTRFLFSWATWDTLLNHSTLFLPREINKM